MRIVLWMMILLAACHPANPPVEAHNPLHAPPVDSVRVPLREAQGWAYRRETRADLDGDGRPERLVITCDVVVRPDGMPLWEDGHRWALFAESAAGERTMLYSAFVPNGFAEAAVLRADDRGRRNLLVQERTPQQVRALEVEYRGADDARSVSSAYYHVESWMPGAAALP